MEILQNAPNPACTRTPTKCIAAVVVGSLALVRQDGRWSQWTAPSPDRRVKKEIAVEFIKKLFSREEPFIPTPSQSIPGLDPMVVQAIEILYPDTEVQKQAIDFSLQFLKDKKGGVLNLLAALSIGVIDLDSPLLDNGKFWLDVMYPDFYNLKAAKKWLKSITKSQS